MSNCQIFTPDEISSFRHGGKILRACLEHVAPLVEPGVTTAYLDAVAEEFIRSHDGALPGFKGYQDFPATLCTSVNEGCVHGIPNDTPLQEGDIVSLDCGVLYDALYTDACVTVGVGEISDEAQDLMHVTEEALKQALNIIKEGTRVGDISYAIQEYAETHGLHPVQSLTGHGLGRTLHQFPDIPNIGRKGTGAQLPANTVVAIEPILSLGSDQVQQSEDGWTLCTRDGALCAHFEHTVLITANGVDIIA